METIQLYYLFVFGFENTAIKIAFALRISIIMHIWYTLHILKYVFVVVVVCVTMSILYCKTWKKLKQKPKRVSS